MANVGRAKSKFKEKFKSASPRPYARSVVRYNRRGGGGRNGNDELLVKLNVKFFLRRSGWRHAHCHAAVNLNHSVVRRHLRILDTPRK